MSECTHDCSTCGQACSERTAPQSFLAAPHEGSHIKHVIAVVSGKGGVGKSMVTSLLAVLAARNGYQTAVLDADITGPSIPKSFGITARATGDETGLDPVVTASGIKVMSLNMLLENDTDPVVWRGPVIAGTVKQFWTDVRWGDVDYMFVDCPPGTGDVPLTVFQSLPVSGVVVVTSPQDLVRMIVGKAVRMAELMNVPVLGLVENMAYFECPNCHTRHAVFGESKARLVADQYGIPAVAQLPLDPALSAAVDAGRAEQVNTDALNALFALLTGEQHA